VAGREIEEGEEMKYKPPKTRSKMLPQELLDEFLDIEQDGFLRMHAQEREQRAIVDELKRRGLVLLESTDPKNDGFDWAIGKFEKGKKLWQNNEMICKGEKMSSKSWYERMRVNKRILTPTFLTEMYLNKKLSTLTIARLLNNQCSATTVRNYLNIYKIPIRGVHEFLVPQRTKEYWTPEKRKIHGEILKNSEAYKIGIKNRKQSGPLNGMFGRKHTIETRKKRSKVRTGKIGENATGWKGGKQSLIKRVKAYIHRTLNWYKRVYARDGFRCTECGGKEKIDAHHIKSISTIVKELLATCDIEFKNSDEKYLWLIKQPRIVDKYLKNGITLCRKCHKVKHKNWGSHYGGGN